MTIAISWQGHRYGSMPIATEYNYLSIDFQWGRSSLREKDPRRKLIVPMGTEQQDYCKHKPIYSNLLEYLHS